MTERLRDIIKSLGRAYRVRLDHAEKSDRGPRGGRARRIGTAAAKLWVENDLPHHTGLEIDYYGQDPWTGVTSGTSGRPRMLDAVDATIAGKRVTFELKRSNRVIPMGEDDYNDQWAAHLIDLAIGTWGAEYYVRFYGLNGYADVWTRGTAEHASSGRRALFSIPAAPEPPIRFGPDVVTPTGMTEPSTTAKRT
jgi:hypothetical protein